MTTAELVYEKVKALPEPQVLRVLDFVKHLPPTQPRAHTLGEIMKLPQAERQRLLQEQMEQAAELYATDPDLKEWAEVTDDYIEYEPAKPR